MKYILFDDVARLHLLPFTHTRPVADIRCGILTMRERWEMCLGAATSSLTEAYLQPVFPAETGDDALFINGAIFGTRSLAAAIAQLNTGQSLVYDKTIIAVRTKSDNQSISDMHKYSSLFPAQQSDDAIDILQHVWDIFSLNDKAIRTDYDLITAGRKTAPHPATITVVGNHQLFIEEGAVMQPGSIINAQSGPVYIAKDAEIMEGCMIRGPFAACEHAVVKMGAKIYGATTIGPGCKVGGEISNTVFFANSNKGHDGYLGNAVIGEWCNLGADTNCSNLKNNYDEIKIWSEATGQMEATGLTFCGLLMGDHSKCGINTMFNTGTVAGVSCNIFGGGFPDKHIPSFSWGGGHTTTYAFDKAMETANRMMGRRNRHLSENEVAMYRYIFEHRNP
jgi:UDP-N-acetylglucosamine diphosphorylase/glucosamine-1-phosphate N-acetyltransferase